ncbi:MAG TPA: dihydrolipoamide acetyltransferase family protein [Candidatus Sulfotelmatobacter sp.]|nr:dihydrolipoamide acetyltransferase family protein [Candidatus Sulfotelmatobacter sp.]
MAFSVVMPALEMAQETGKLLAWRKKEGDRVAKGEPLLDIETDKAVVEVEAPADGFLAGISAAEGADIPVGQTIAWIVEAGENPPAETSAVAPAARVAARSKPEAAHVSPARPGASVIPAASAKVSPKARRLAKQLGVDIALLRGTGPGGEVVAADVEAASKPGDLSADAASHDWAKQGQAGETEVPTSVGRIMAERTTQSWTTVPHFFVSRDVDATGLNEYRQRAGGEIERGRGIRITHTDLLAAVVARVLLKHPRLNASWSEGGIRLHGHVNLGIAIAVKDGVVAAVIHDAQAASLAEIASRRSELTERARAGKLRPADISEATFTISNLGMYQVDQFSAIITPPQAAILAVGAIADRVIAMDGNPVVRPMMTLTISCDHRVADGARAAMFLGELAQALQRPEQILS